MSRPQQDWPISADRILEGTAALPARLREAVRSAYFLAHEDGLTIDDVADGIGYHTRNVQKLICGTYDGDLDSVTDKVEAWVRAKREQKGARVLFVETSTSKQIFELATLTWQYRTVGAIWGDSQIGKTHALQEFRRRHEPGIVKFMRFPTGIGRLEIMLAIAKACGLPPNQGQLRTIRNRIFEVVGQENLFIFDELHEAFLTYSDLAVKYALEFIREVHDVCGCAVLICGTNVGRDGIARGKFCEVFEQLRRRNPFALQLPAYATRADLNAIAAHYGLPRLPAGPAQEIVTQVTRQNGLKAYCIYLDSARQLAANRKEAITWQHLVTAYDLVRKTSNPRKTDDAE